MSEVATTGLTWHQWKRLVVEVEQMGFAGLFCSDHFLIPVGPPPDSLDMMVLLTYLADHTQRVHFGPMVAPLSFRHPVMLARQAVALDILSGGRVIVGVGAGWQEREHQMFGYDLGDIPTRMARFAEGLEVITGLLQSDAPFSYDGQFFQVREALLRPRPSRPGGLPILIGGSGPRRTLPLVARYATIWNATRLTPNEFRERSSWLDMLAQAVGRQPGMIKRTITLPIVCGRDTAERERRVQGFRRFSVDFAALPLDDLLNNLRSFFTSMIVGTADEVVDGVRAYADAGVEELMIQWFDVNDLEGLEVLAEQVLPHVAD